MPKVRRHADLISAESRRPEAAAAHRRAAPRHGDLAKLGTRLSRKMFLAGIKYVSGGFGSPYRGPTMRGTSR
ncbi:hypothetical protein DU478_01300 [Thalassococcus profundi]|uniref:Uncharacterized protein n=1 Tax=Thalassococcus profundi TaxID=2282382 RepID=A0A369TTB3_9RHOB|nr:hypothetical protein DU478_01300 [Thalassococcus profundi]